MGWMVNTTPRQLYPQGKNPVLIVQEAKWAPGSVWGGGAEYFASTGIRSSGRLTCSKSLYLSVHFTKQSSAFWAVLYKCVKLLIQLYQDNGITQQHELCGYPENCTGIMHEVLRKKMHAIDMRTAEVSHSSN